ncbi:hypothetical protein [Simiduia agarivorans]|uniref:Uncharacterized protein n=1 Tax=Simiduia agarivorans (strain DSM 21679 / JCM 13881 / BCRC 17597 / SA1) TaxID=1117647 RepID=K4L2K7_SIMAS|nr:hypothetical protein [Simiduia agarivorans]AFV00428.2 hypothetical protein M5M_16485 [Simiduia agarivorans SA1 = DSM 21679]
MRNGWIRVLEQSYGKGAQGRDVYVSAAAHPFFVNLELKKESSFQLMSLFRAVLSLNASPNSGDAMNGAATLRNLRGDGFAIEYYLDNGDVLISKLRFSGELTRQDSSFGTGLFEVVKGSSWVTRQTPSQHMDLLHRWDGAHYAAVAGKFVSSHSAGSRLITHIKKAYSKEVLERTVESPTNLYSMYWTESKKYGQKSDADALASLLQQAADAKAPVNWLVHGEGVKTFNKALEILKSAPSLSRYAAADEEIVRNLRAKFAEQKVFLSNPIGADEKSIKPLCNIVGLTWVDQHINSRDLRSSASRRNVYKEIASLSGKAVVGGGAAGVGLKELGVSSLQKAGAAAVDICSSAVANPTVQSVALAAGAAYGVFVAGKGVYTKSSGAYKAAKAMMISTFGAGSEFWYENDDDLFEQMSA